MSPANNRKFSQLSVSELISEKVNKIVAIWDIKCRFCTSSLNCISSENKLKNDPELKKHVKQVIKEKKIHCVDFFNLDFRGFCAFKPLFRQDRSLYSVGMYIRGYKSEENISKSPAKAMAGK